jgi:hypothetical protein
MFHHQNVQRSRPDPQMRVQHNHSNDSFSMTLIALKKMGATSQRLHEFYQVYSKKYIYFFCDF